MKNKNGLPNLIIGLIYVIIGFGIPFFVLSMVFLLIFPIIFTSYVFNDILNFSVILFLTIAFNFFVVHISTKYTSIFLIHRYHKFNRKHVTSFAFLFIGILFFIPNVIRGFSISYSLLLALSAIPFYFTSRVYLR